MFPQFAIFFISLSPYPQLPFAYIVIKLKLMTEHVIKFIGWPIKYVRIKFHTHSWVRLQQCFLFSLFLLSLSDFFFDFFMCFLISNLVLIPLPV